MTDTVPWAKAPTYAGQPEVLAALRAATAADRRGYLESGFCPVSCANCGNQVLVRKNSMAQTSVQWSADAVAHCPRFAERVADGGSTALIEGCPSLADSIDKAVLGGAIEVPDA
jgi:hypothetical protein